MRTACFNLNRLGENNCPSLPIYQYPGRLGKSGIFPKPNMTERT